MSTQEKKSIPTSLLVSAAYSREKNVAVLKFYNPESQELKIWYDETGHKPYCYSKLTKEELDVADINREEVEKIEQVKKYDLLKDCEIDVLKISVSNPLAIGGTDSSLRNRIDTWESDIKYYENYLYDRSLNIGKYYKIEDGKIIPQILEISDEVRLSLKSLLWDKMVDDEMVNSKQFQEYVSDWAELLNQPIPKIKRISFDIEVEAEVDRLPDAKIADRTVTAIGFEGSDDFKQIFVLRLDGVEEGKNELPSDVKVEFYDKEKEMIQDAFKKISEYPFVITYNGDDFDMPYLYNRAQRLGIKQEDNPLYMMRDSATLKEGVHIDLYRTLSNRSFQIYAFSHKYTNFSLNSVSKALLNEEKIDYGIELGKLNLYQLRVLLDISYL